jgi:hypothetical protein
MGVSFLSHRKEDGSLAIPCTQGTRDLLKVEIDEDGDAYIWVSIADRDGTGIVLGKEEVNELIEYLKEML